MEEEQDKMKSTRQVLSAKIGDFKKTLTAHQKLMADVGALLRTIEKAEELEVPEIKLYLLDYRDFTDKIAIMLKKLADDFNEDSVNDIMTDIESLKDVIPGTVFILEI